MFSFNSMEHALASWAKKVVEDARVITAAVVPVLKKAQANEQTIEAVTALVSPQAVVAERAAFAVLGKALKAVTDGQAAAAQNGINIALDQTEIDDLKSLAGVFHGVAPVTAQ
jgi:predicted negative regulator of RcsB-dependent stress response